MATTPIRKWTPDDYLAFDDESDIKHEFMNGDIYAMSGGTERRSIITSNILGSLWQSTRHLVSRVYSNQMRVKIDDDTYFYPDVSVVCGKAEFDNEKNLSLVNPTLIVEVTSKSSESFDKGVKANLYRGLESVQAYLVVDQNQLFAQLSTRQGKGWYLQQFTTRQQAIPLNAIGVDLPMADVYLDIEFDDVTDK